MRGVDSMRYRGAWQQPLWLALGVNYPSRNIDHQYAIEL
jgi:hypothetical protein